MGTSPVFTPLMLPEGLASGPYRGLWSLSLTWGACHPRLKLSTDLPVSPPECGHLEGRPTCEMALNPHRQAWHLERRRVLGCSVCERVNIDEGICAKMWYKYTTEYDSAIKKMK